MKHRLLAAISLLSAGCAGAEPATVTPGQPAAPAEVTVTQPPPPAEAKQAAEEPANPPAGSPKADSKPGIGETGSLTQDVGATFGAGGLGAGGLGLGGGGRGDAIGLGTIGGLGHGAGTGTGYGYGRGGLKKADGPEVRISALTVTSGLPMEVVRRIVRQNYGRYRLCYERGLQNNPKLGGDVTIKFVIEPNGLVSGASDGGSTMPDKAVVACLVAAYSGLSFPNPDAGGKVSVTSPMSFAPAPPQPATPPPPASGSAPAGTPKK